MNEKQLREIIIEQNKNFPGKLEHTILRESLSKIAKLNKLPHIVIISGIRRVGKSTLLKQIAHTYYPNGNYYYFNFEDERLLDFQADDFNTLYEICIELKGMYNTFFFDEIQNVKNWESFVRRMYDRKMKFYITGSNASLLSKEIGTKLTGRHQTIELFPFSYTEYLLLHNIDYDEKTVMDTEMRAVFKRHFNTYIACGGMPEYLLYNEKEILQRMYDDILFRDIATRYALTDIRSLREIALFLVNNTAQLISFNKIKEYFKLGSVNTVTKYIDFLESSYLFFVIHKFSFSIKQQLIAPKKVYCIDNGIASSLAFQFSENKGDYLENLVLVHLMRSGREVFYYKTENGKEVDFLIKEKKQLSLIQVSYSIQKSETFGREVSALETAMNELKLNRGMILTQDEEDVIKIDKKTIEIKPIYSWLLEGMEGQ